MIWSSTLVSFPPTSSNPFPLCGFETCKASAHESSASLAHYYQDDKLDCEKGITPLNCANGPFICEYGDMGNSYIWDSRSKKWICGMPKIGLGGAEDTGLDSNAPTPLGYAPGTCWVSSDSRQQGG